MEIAELRSEAGLQEAFPVVRELHHELDEQRYALRDRGRIAAVAGVQVLTNLYHGRHVYVYDLVATADARSKGYGEKLLTHVEEFARGEGCDFVALACGRERTGALRFYEERMGYERPGYSMRKALRQVGPGPAFPSLGTSGAPCSFDTGSRAADGEPFAGKLPAFAGSARRAGDPRETSLPPWVL